jgi:hypothetical protein
MIASEFHPVSSFGGGEQKEQEARKWRSNALQLQA